MNGSTLIQSQLADLEQALSDHRVAVASDQAEAVISAVNDIATWVVHFQSNSVSGVAVELLGGAQAAALETVAYVFLGLGRAALTAIRLQIELLLAYTYFKDHAVEWDRVRRTGDGFMMVSAVEAYHREINRETGARLEMIEQRASPTLRQVYRLLSAHVHGQSPYTLPKAGPLGSVVFQEDLLKSVVEMQRKSMDAISFFLVAVYAGRWPELPAQFVFRVSSILTPRQRVKFFAETA